MQTQGLKRKYTTSQILVEVICFLFIYLFVYASVSKLIDYQKFKVQIGQSPILTSIAGWVAWIIPALELTIASLLFFPKWKRLGLHASFALMVLFTTYIIAITQFSEYIPCSCGGILENMNWNQHLKFNIIFVALAIAGICLISYKPTHFIAIKPGETENL